MKWKLVRKKILKTLLLLVLCGAIPPWALAGDTQKVTVFASASTTNAITEIGRLFSERRMGRFIPSFASSSTLAKQIDWGAPADLYLSANPRWMIFLEKKGMIAPGTRADLLGNRIVLIAPLSGKEKVAIGPGFDLAGLLGEEKIAMGDPDHVPAGMYGMQALKSLGVWAAVAPKVARSKDVRAALALVARGEVPLGIVYATDAAISKKVKVVGVFPEDSHPAITYPVALVAKNITPAARSFLAFLKTPAARAVFETYGFSVL